MPEKAWRIRRLYVAEESTFNTDPSSDGSSGYSFLRGGEMTFKPTVDVIARDVQTDDLTRTAHVMGSKSATLSFRLEGKGSGTEAGNSTAAIAAEADLILKHALGSVTRGTGTTLSANASAGATSITVTSAAGLSKYMAIVIGGTNKEIGIISSISGTTVNLVAGLRYAHSTSDVVYASSMYSPANTGHKSLAFVADIDGVLYTLTGCVLESLAVEGLSANGVPTLNCSFKAATWATGGKGSLPATTAATAWPKPPVAKGAACWVGTSTKLVHEFSFTPGVEFQYKMTTQGDDGKSDFLLVNRAATGQVKPYYASADWDDFRQGTERGIGVGVGDEDNGFALYAAKCQYTDWQLEERNGMVGNALPFAVNDNGSDNDFVICLF